MNGAVQDTSKLSVSAIAAELDSDCESENLHEEYSNEGLKDKMEDSQFYDLRGLYHTGPIVTKNPQSISYDN